MLTRNNNPHGSPLSYRGGGMWANFCTAGRDTGLFMFQSRTGWTKKTVYITNIKTPSAPVAATLNIRMLMRVGF